MTGNWRTWASRVAGAVLLLPLIVLTIGVPLDGREQWQCAGATIVGALLLARGYEEGSIAKPGDFVLERAFVET